MSFSALVVDDEPSILEAFSLILQMHRFEVQTASSSTDAIQALEASHFDLVVTDMSMETDTAGIAVVKAAKSQAYKPAVIILSAYPDLAANWKAYGADAMFHKPTILADFISRIDELMELRRLC
jgi:DNA-binding NtrC family response regulator